MVKTVRPESYGDVFYVGHYFREGVAVVMDLTALSNVDAVPLVDFAAGLIVGRGGFMERIAPKVFLLRPPETADARVNLEPAPA
jgi:cell division inhibitor SepF